MQLIKAKTTQKTVVVVIPTYNEINNIDKLILQLEDVVAQSPQYDFKILIVDDNSPDGTADLVVARSFYYPNLYLLRGEKQGLGTAYLRGFRHAIKNLGASIIVQMDADFSHNPYDIPKLLENLDGNDIVIGSRYVAGGSIPKDWPAARKINSKLGNIIARHLAGLKSINDCTAGFKAIKTKIFKKINLNNIWSRGYSFQINLLYLALKAGAKIKEVPISFVDRELGSSKMALFDKLEFIAIALKIRWLNLKKTLARAFFILSAIATIVAIDYYLYTGGSPLYVFFLVFTLITLAIMAQSLFTLSSMIYIWENPAKINESESPKRFRKPRYSFTAIIPALHEESVIGSTLQAVAGINYPESLKEIIVVCRDDYQGTIEAASQAISKLKRPSIRLLVPEKRPKNKPDKLNHGLSYATKDIVVIFDAEDSPHPDIYKVVNTVLLRDKVDVVQSGVQLINYRSKWFSTLNVLEYYFWFKSVLHLFSKTKAVLLGGNTVFFKRRWLKKVGGWDADCLTEDADIGIRLSAAGASIKIIYDEIHATQEETPPNLSGFIKQRTRWNQGFIQIYKKNVWNLFPTARQKALVSYLLVWPIFQTFMFIYVMVSIVMIFTLKLPIILALISYLPLYILLMQIIILNLGLYEFTRKYHLKYPVWMPLKITLTFFPYQLILGYSALRASIREMLKNNGWEKTEHVNAHRDLQFKGIIELSKCVGENCPK